MPGIAGDRIGLLLVTVERHRVIAAILHPERGLEAGRELVGLGIEPDRQLGLAADRREPRHPPLRVVHVALDLGQRDRWDRVVAVSVADRVAGVLPALVQQAAL